MDHLKEEDQSFFRPDGGVFQSLQTATTQRGGTLIRSTAFPIRTEEVIALIGFGLGRRFHSAGYVGQTELNQLNLDRTFLLFIQAGMSSILPQMLQISKTWHGQREQGKVDRPLRQLMFQLVFEELASRAAQLPLGSNDHELILALRSKQILTTTNAWNYLQWDHQDKTLKPSSRDPISSEEASKMIERIHTLANKPELIHRFTALKPMPSDQVGPTSNVVIPWRLDISLRGSASQELFDLLTKLTCNGLTQLIAVRLRPSTLQ